MYEYKDLFGVTRAATISAFVSMVFSGLFGMGGLYAAFLQPYPAAPGELSAVDLIGLGYFVAFIVTIVLVGRWIYRASANAHVLSDDMTISAGWAVGWYFVPVLSLFKPFQAMRETWQASHPGSVEGDDWNPPVLTWWWGFWIVTNILGNISLRLGSEAQQIGAILHFAAAASNVPLTMLLVSIMRQISAAQSLAIRTQVFA